MPNKLAAIATVVFILVVWFLVLWFSIRAKPLGPKPYQKPYRWATYVASTTGLMSLVYFLAIFAAFKNGKIFVGVLFALMAVLCAATCVLLLRRQRLGVAVFFVTYALIFMFPTIVSASEGRKQTVQEIEQGSLFFIYFLITGYYMWKRWHLFSKPAKHIAAPLSG